MKNLLEHNISLLSMSYLIGNRSIAFEALVDHLPHICWMTDANGENAKYNKQWCTYTGLSREKTTLRDQWGTIHPSDLDCVFEVWSNALKTLAPFMINCRLQDVKGQYQWFLVRGMPIYGDDGKALGWIGTCSDVDDASQPQHPITHIVESIDEELVRAKEDAAQASLLRTSFLTNMSHEIRTPLVSIMGFAELLKDETLAIDDRHRFLSMIIRNGSKLSRTIDDILDLSKVETGELDLESVDVSLDKLLHSVLSVFREQARNKNIFLRMKIDSRVPTTVKTDPTRLHQILINLVGNAVKFTSEGGISVFVENEVVKDNLVKIIIRVTDTGVGISEEQKQRLFKPFSQADNSTTRKFGGTGLGLTLSKKIAMALKGDIQIVESGMNCGTTFEINFLAEAAVSENDWKHASTTRLESRVDLNHLNILLAEDALDSQELIKYVLTTHGANVQVASNGAEALRLARENKFDVVLMDVQMPELDGYEVTRALRAESYNQPIIALTAHAMNDERKKSKDAGCDGHITKPVDFSHLLLAVKEITAAH